jgi:hypothetical protein
VVQRVRFQVNPDDFGLTQNPGNPFKAWKGLDPFIGKFISIHLLSRFLSNHSSCQDTLLCELTQGFIEHKGHPLKELNIDFAKAATKMNWCRIHPSDESAHH